MDKTILITGASGFIGKRLIYDIQGMSSSEVFAFCRDEDIEEVRSIRGDLRDYDDVQRAFYESDPSLVVHLAAVAPVGWCYKAPRQTITSNTVSAINVLDACREFSNIPLIFVSSDKSYGKPLDTPVKESTELNPRHPYDASKAAADMIAISYACTYELPLQIVRPCNVYGPGDRHWNRLIPGAIKAALLSQPLKLRSDGSPIRNYVYIDDLSIALFGLIETMLNEEGTIIDFGIWNIAPEKSAYSVGEVLATIDTVLGTKLKIVTDLKKEGETDILTVDGSLFRTTFGWEPKVDLEYGIELTTAWMNTIL